MPHTHGCCPLVKLCLCAEAMDDTWLCDVTGGWTRGGGGGFPKEDEQWVLPPLVGSTRPCHGSSDTVPLHNHTHVNISVSFALHALTTGTEGMWTWSAVLAGLHREADVTGLLVAMEFHIPTAIGRT